MIEAAATGLTFASWRAILFDEEGGCKGEHFAKDTEMGDCLKRGGGAPGLMGERYLFRSIEDREGIGL